jgi:hypothetical protein
MARRKELGAFANKSLNITCFTSKIKCEACGCSFVRSTRRNKAKLSPLGDKITYWVCSSTKKKGGRCTTTKDIPEHILKKVCAEVLGLEEFDEGVFAEKVERIVVPDKDTMVFHFADGASLTQPWVNTSKKDCWTPERRAQHSEQLKKRVYTNEQRQARSERAKARWAANPYAFRGRVEE